MSAKKLKAVEPEVIEDYEGRVVDYDYLMSKLAEQAGDGKDMQAAAGAAIALSTIGAIIYDRDVFGHDDLTPAQMTGLQQAINPLGKFIRRATDNALELMQLTERYLAQNKLGEVKS